LLLIGGISSFMGMFVIVLHSIAPFADGVHRNRLELREGFLPLPENVVRRFA
jgi:hypothetical protein